MAGVRPSQNTQIYSDVPYVENPEWPYGAFTICLPASVPGRYIVELTPYRENLESHLMESYTKCESCFYQCHIKGGSAPDNIEHPLCKVKFSGKYYVLIIGINSCNLMAN